MSSFQVDGDILKVLASATVEVTEEQFVMRLYGPVVVHSFVESEFAYSGA